MIRVSDTGIGMDATTQERVFDAFSQADTGLVRAQGGLGLGLALVKGLADMHYGAVQCSSEGLGRGSTFSVSLPLAQAPASVPSPATGPAASVERTFRVLVIEDNVDAATSLRLLLRSLGHDVRVAHTGVEGVAEARRWTPEIVLCDIGLPGMDGYEVCRVLRRDATTRGAWMLSQSGYGQQEDHRRSASAGFDRHLTKPLDFAELTSLLANHRPSPPPALAG
jgi:two-component system CheB/CheR fusion protein